MYTTNEGQRTLLPHRSSFTAVTAAGAVATPIVSPAPPRKGHLCVIDAADGEMHYHLTTNLRDTQQGEDDAVIWTSVTGAALRHTVCTTLLPHLCAGTGGGEAAVRLLCNGVPVRDDAYLPDGVEVRIERAEVAAGTTAVTVTETDSNQAANGAETSATHDAAALVVTPLEVSLSASQETERGSVGDTTCEAGESGATTTYLGALRAEVARLHRCLGVEAAQFCHERDNARSRARTQYDELVRYIAARRAALGAQRVALAKEVTVQLASRARVQRARQVAQQRTAVLRDKLHHTVTALDTVMQNMQALWQATGVGVDDEKGEGEYDARGGAALARSLIVSSARRQVLQGRYAASRRDVAASPCAAQEPPTSGPTVRVVARLRPCSAVPWWAPSSMACATSRRTSNYSVRLDVPRHCVVLHHPAKGERRVTLDAVYAAQASLHGEWQPVTQSASCDTNSSDSLFARELVPLLRHMCQQGRPVCVLTYGAPDSGKSYTLFGGCGAGGADVASAITDAVAPAKATVAPSDRTVGIAPVPYSTVMGDVDAASCDEVVSLDATLVPRETDWMTEIGRNEDDKTTEAAAADGGAMKKTQQAEAPLLMQILTWLMSHRVAADGPGSGADDARIHNVEVAVYELYRNRLYDLLEAVDRPPTELTLERRAGCGTGGTEPVVPAKRVTVAGAGPAVQLIVAALSRRHGRGRAAGSRGHVFVDFALTVSSATTPTPAKVARPRAPPCLCDDQRDTLQEALGLDTPRWPKVNTASRQRRVRRRVHLVLADLAAAAPPMAPHSDDPDEASAAIWADEARYINRELAALGNVLAALSHPPPPPAPSPRHGCETEQKVAVQAITARNTSDVMRVWDVAQRTGMSFSRESPILLPASKAAVTAATPRSRTSGWRDKVGDDCEFATWDVQSTSHRLPVAVTRALSSSVPYRDNRLTEVLQPVLAGGQVLLIACLRPCEVTEVSFTSHDGAPLHCRAKKAAHVAQLLFTTQAPQLMAEAQATLAFARRVRATSPHSVE